MMKRKMIGSLVALSLITTLTITAGGFGKNKNSQLLKGSDNKEYQYVICRAQNDEVNFADRALSSLLSTFLSPSTINSKAP